VNEHQILERRYRRLMTLYPSTYRRENQDELIAVLMAATPEGARRPSLATSLNLIKSGLGMRLHPRAPESAPSVRAAVRLMYAGAIFTALSLFLALDSLDYFSGGARLRFLGKEQPLSVAIAVGVVFALVLIAFWLVLARGIGQGRNWARIVATALFALATAHLFGTKGAASFIFAVVTWLVGLATVFLLWRPSSSAYFDSQRAASGDCAPERPESA
jgi:hypothetical protein